jgi:hypothetical protein
LSDEAKLNVDQIKSFLDTDPEGQKLAQSYTDAKVTKGIETWQQNNLDKLLTERVEQEITKRYPAESEEQRQLRAIRAELEQEKQTRIRAELRARAVEEVNTKGLPSELVGYFVGTDEEQTAQNIAKLDAVWKSHLQKAVEARFADGGRAPVVTKPDGQGASFTREQIAAMPQDEQIRRWGEISKALAEGRVRM